MGKNLDTSNIFSSYMDNVLLKEADGQLTSQIPALQQLLNDPNTPEQQKSGIKQMIANAEAFSKQSGSQAQQAPPQPATQPVDKSSAQAVPEKRAENPYTTEYQGPSIVDFLAKSGQKSDMASRQALAQRMGIQNYKGTAEQNTQMLNALKKQAQDFAKTPQVATPAQVAQAQQPATTSPEKPLQVGNVSIGKPSGTAPTPPSQTSIPTQQPVNVGGGITIGNPTGSQNEPTKTSQVTSTQKPAKPEASEEEANEENCEDCENNCEKCKKNKSNALNKITVQEKVNISKFLKHLSEKNYSSAHKYLKAIVDDKVNAKIAQRIAKI